MRSFHTSESCASDALLNESLSDYADDGTVADESLRLARIDEYSIESLNLEDCEAANFGAINGGIFRLVQQYENKVFKLLDESGEESGDSPELNRAVSMLLNLTRQAERNANLIARLNDARRQNAMVNSNRPPRRRR